VELGLRTFPSRSQIGDKLLWELRPAEGRDPLNLRQARHREQAWNNWHTNARFPTATAKLEEVVIVVKQLGEHDIGSGIYYPTQVFQVGFQVRGLNMLFRVARHGETQPRAKLLANESD